MHNTKDRKMNSREMFGKICKLLERGNCIGRTCFKYTRECFYEREDDRIENIEKAGNQAKQERLYV